MASEPAYGSADYLTAISAHRARRGAHQASRFAAFNEACARGDGDPYNRRHAATRDIETFLHGELARPETLQKFLTRAAGSESPLALPQLQPARVFDHDMVTLEGIDVLIPAMWWTRKSRFPRPAVDGMLTLMPRNAITPVFMAYYGSAFSQDGVIVQVGDRSTTPLACVWAGDRFGPGPVPPPSSRRMFFYGTLTNPEVLRDVLQVSARYVIKLTPAVLHGWHIRRWGQYPALVRAARADEAVNGFIYDCHGDFIKNVEKYEGDNYAPTEVQVTLDGSDDPITAWCFVWNGSLDSLQEEAK